MRPQLLHFGPLKLRSEISLQGKVNPQIFDLVFSKVSRFLLKRVSCRLPAFLVTSRNCGASLFIELLAGRGSLVASVDCVTDPASDLFIFFKKRCVSGNPGPYVTTQGILLLFCMFLLSLLILFT